MTIHAAIMAGGPSSERVISLQTAENIANSLPKEKYSPYIIDVKGPAWIYNPGKPNETPVDKNEFSLTLDGKKIQFDVAVIAIHGKQGEDGTLQGYFETMSIPYSTSGVLCSALTFDKIKCKAFISNYNIPMAPEMVFKKGDKIKPLDIVSQLGLPLFVKPNTAGSSFGITKVYDTDKITEAINHAFTEDDTVIIESFIEGVEVSCGLLKTGKHGRVFEPTEIDTKRDFFDYDAKYTPELTDEITPARIPQSESDAVKSMASMIYDKLNCRGIVRIDFIIKDSIPHFLEVNTIPGLSKNSIVPKQIRHAGLTESQVLDEAIADCMKQR
ncbi:MAG: D-alanine--D-alanine ligase [Candidatus Delongbacteria bacterium]|jgi:D-alanine-D-alanine ligase|nr:D-alanine--D-alanine ligase [Candidatus Delongbacteria bacterium]